MMRDDAERLETLRRGLHGARELLELIEESQERASLERRCDELEARVESWRDIPPVNRVSLFSEVLDLTLDIVGLRRRSGRWAVRSR